MITVGVGPDYGSEEEERQPGCQVARLPISRIRAEGSMGGMVKMVILRRTVQKAKGKTFRGERKERNKIGSVSKCKLGKDVVRD